LLRCKYYGFVKTNGSDSALTIVSLNRLSTSKIPSESLMLRMYSPGTAPFPETCTVLNAKSKLKFLTL
jgi:hypothetical protein